MVILLLCLGQRQRERAGLVGVDHEPMMPCDHRGVSFTAAEGRQRILDDLATAIGQLGVALAALGAAYEKLDEQRSDELEERLFRPVQLAYGRAKRTHSEFADRYGLPRRAFADASPGPESQDARELLERAATGAREADTAIAELQDSLLPVEVGDQELRAGLSEARALIDLVPAQAERLSRLVGR
jgi:hypothetical protein